MPISLRSENLKPIISVQNLVLRSMSLTFKTTCPIFLIFIGDFSSAIGSSFDGPLIGFQTQELIKRPPRQTVVYHGNGIKAKRARLPTQLLCYNFCFSILLGLSRSEGSNLMSDSQAIYPPFPRPYAIDHTC